MNDSRKDAHLVATQPAYAGNASILSHPEPEADTLLEPSTVADAVDRGALNPGSSLSEVNAPLEFLPALLGIGEESIPVPLLPEGISEEESLSMSTLSSVLTAYYRTLPESVRGEYVSQVMRFAGEKAGQLIRICSEH